MHKLILIVIVMGASALGSANASEHWAGCNACSDSQQRRVATRAVPDRQVGSSDVYIMDFEREVVSKYQVNVLYEPRDGGYFKAAMKVAVESHVAYEFRQTVQHIKADFAKFEAGTPIPAEVVGSAYDIVHSSIARQRVSDYINGHMSIWQTIAAPVSIPLSALGKIVNIKLTVSVTFSDGSGAKFVLTGVEGALGSIAYTFELIDGSAKDADGNVIPANSAEAAPFVGEFSGQEYAKQMVDFIVRWYSESGSPVECKSEVSPGGVTVTCKRR